MIFYVSEKRPELLDAVCDKLYLAVTKIHNTHIKNLVIGNAAAFTVASRFVIDLSSVKDTPDEIIEAIEALRSLNSSARVIVIADGESPGSSLINKLLNMGIYDIVLEPNQASLKKSLTTGYAKDEAIINCAYVPAPAVESLPQPVPGIREIYKANRNFKKRKPYVTIAICAAEPHIGATHQALLMAKFLTYIGFRVCYLEANRRRKIVYLANIYPINANERKHLIQYEGIDIYFDFNTPEVVDMGYDFFIYDMGRLNEMDANSFTTKDLRFIVGGVKAWEIPSYNAVLGMAGAEKSFSFILNHAPASEMAMIRDMMSGFKLYFSDYAPYPFEFGVNLRAYKEIFKEYLTVSR